MTKSAPFIYQQVKGALVDMISSGQFHTGDRLPSERQLAKKLGCNYHTVRKGLAILEDERVIERRVGAGTFLRKIDTKAQPGNGFTNGSPFSATAKGVMGVIAPSKLGEFGTGLLHHFHQLAEDRGFRINLRTVSGFGSPAREAAREFVEQGCRVLFLPVLSASVSADEMWELVKPLSIPVVLGRFYSGLEKYCYEKKEVFGRPTFAAVEMACQYFRELGYDHIAFFGADDKEEEDLQRRVLAYTRFAYRNELQTYIGLVGPRAEEVDSLVSRWSSRAGNLAVVCEGDEDALRLMTAAHKQNLRIPQDIAILGFKNIPMAATSDPPLSTIQFDYDYVAGAMLNHAEALLQGTSAQGDGCAKQKLIIRESCSGKLRAGAELPAIIEKVQAEHDKIERQSG